MDSGSAVSRRHFPCREPLALHFYSPSSSMIPGPWKEEYETDVILELGCSLLYFAP